MKIIKGESIEAELLACGIDGKFCRFSISPQIVSYYFKLNNPQQIKKALKLSDVLTNWSGQKMECNNEGGFLCITTPTTERQTVSITSFKNIKPNQYQIILGIDTNGNARTESLNKLTHILFAGTTGSGKSVALNSVIMGLCCYNNPQDLGLILIDPKHVEFNTFESLPHLVEPIKTETADILKTLNNLYTEMETRYKMLKAAGVEKNNGHFKKIVVVIDELADLILSNNQIKDILIKLLQKSRAAGIHFIIATQSPRASILNGLILANLPTKIALTCASVRESMLILGHKGAETLTGKGDAIVKTPQDITEFRTQFPYITKKQIKKLINN